MPFVLTTDSIILCGPVAPKLHGGKIDRIGTPKLIVAGNEVVLETGLGSVTGCATVPPPPGQTPCTTVSSITTGKSTKLFVGGVPVLLETLLGMTDGVPSGPLSATANQIKLTAV
jgi:hypothetical protein